MWWPTFCKPESLSTLMKEMATPEAVKAFVGMLKNRNPLGAWKGTWVNPISFLDDLVACNAKADLLIILSDIDGLYDADPRRNPDARLIPEVAAVTEAIEANSTTKGSSMSSGGMATKLAAARIAMSNGIPMVIASSDERSAVRRIAGGEPIGTFFVPGREGYAARRQWLAVGSRRRI